MELRCAASLAHHGLLGSVYKLRLYYVDLSPVPAQHLASLFSCVTRELRIENVSGCDLVSLLSSLKCKWFISRQSLGREETRALVRAMETGLKALLLGCGEMTLDMEALAEYSGQGVCRVVELYYNTATRSKNGELMQTAGARQCIVLSNVQLLTDNQELFVIQINKLKT